MRFLALSLLFVCALSAANQNRLQFEAAYPIVPQNTSTTPPTAGNPVGTPFLVGTIYSSQPGTSVTLTLADAWMEFASSPTGCPTGSGSKTQTVTAPSPIYVCVLSTYPAATDPLTPQITATASGFPIAYDYLPISFGKSHAVTASPSGIDLSQGQQSVTLAVSGTSANGAPAITYASGSNWLTLGGSCSSTSWTAGSCNISANSSGLTAGQQYAALVAFKTASNDSATVVVTYTYPGTSLAITSGLVLPFGEFQAVNTKLNASGGTPPYTWSATGLPPGLSISSSGVISGTVAFLNTWTPQITAQDAAAHSATETLTVAPSSISFTSVIGAAQGSGVPIFVGYLTGPPPGAAVTITTLFSPPPQGSTTPIPFTLGGSATCPASAPSSPTSATVITPSPIYACLYGVFPLGISNYSFTATAAGFPATTWTFRISNGGIGFWLLATPPGPVELSAGSVPVTASIQNSSGSGSSPHVASVCVSYSNASNTPCVASSSGQPGEWVTFSPSSCGTSTSCTITVGVNWNGQTPPPGTPQYKASLLITDTQGDAEPITLTYTAAAAAAPVPLRFIPISPCRVVDTRDGDGFSGGPLTSGATGNYVIPSSPRIGNNNYCPGVSSIPSTAAAYALNVLVLPIGSPGYLPFITVWPMGQTQPDASTLNSYDGRIKSNAAIVPAGANGGVSVFSDGNTNLAIDVTGYFVPASNTSALTFYTLPPCRVVDTRSTSGSEGAGAYVPGSSTGDVNVVNYAISGICNVPSSALAYSLNFTALPRKGQLTYLTVWPAGQSQPGASTLNAPTGTTTANAAIIPAGSNGQISVYASDDTDLLIDVNGYFAPSPAGQDGLSFYTLAPCRVLNTLSQGSSPLHGPLSVSVATSTSCSVPSAAQAYVFNATVLPQSPLTYLSLLPDPQGLTAPPISTLNAFDGAITSNLAIVPVTNGSIDAYASNPTYLILDIFGYFAP